ncbi:MAG TPA: hypothetical protein VJP02_08255 [Candidatus Sulfotelmatobacter sp.]|nr:hypothetical protein [Candidatus Sulfotelmatobacter sp.]
MSSRFAVYAVLFSVWLSGTWASAGAAAQEASSNGVPVHMVVTVEARHGANVPAIAREDVMVYQGRDRDKVTDWVPFEGDHAGLDLFVLIDDSSNISLGSQLEDIRQFIDAQPRNVRIGVAYMQNGTAQLVQDLTSDHAFASKGLRLPLGIAGANASPYFSLGDLIKRWPESTARREVLIVSDGVDRFWGSGPGNPYVESVIEQAQRAGIIVFAIYTPGVGHYGHSFWRMYWGQIHLSRLADGTGGEGYSIGFYGPPVSFVPYLDDLAHRLTRQYRLTFLARPEKKAGMQQVKVVTEVPNAEIVSADRVYVPMMP